MVITGLTRNQLAGQPARGFESRRLRLKSADFKGLRAFGFLRGSKRGSTPLRLPVASDSFKLTEIPVFC